MDKLELEAIANREVRDCIGLSSGQVVDDREKALKYYRGEPFGDEVEGRSQVVSRDVLDSVEWMLPSLLRVFASGDDVVEFQPVGPEDEAAAKQATEYANFIFNNDNPGFSILHDWFKDALLQKVGVVKHWWEVREVAHVALYTGLDDMTLATVAGDDDTEVLEHSSYEDPAYMPPAPIPGMPELPPAPMLHDIRIRTVKKEGRVRVECVPPEEFLISSRARSLDDAGFVGHKRQVTRSELIEMGFDKDEVFSMGDAGDEDSRTGERETRFYDEERQTHSGDSIDPAQRRITVIDGVMRVDINDDGKAELVRVVLAGTGDYKVMEWEETNRVPFSALCPVPIPHKFWGMSLADLTMDVQLIKSTLLRQTLDNLYLTNNPEREVVMSGVVNMDDFLTSRPGGIKRVKQAGTSREIQVPFAAAASFPMLEYLDKVKESRTGSMPAASVDSEALQNQSATAVNFQQNAAAQRVELIARLFAETGVKDLFRNILRIICEHQDKPRAIRLRNQWVPMDPRYWNNEMDVSINVGLGNGNKDQQSMYLGAILAAQKEALLQTQGDGLNGMVKPKHVYNTLAKMVNLAGFKNVNMFFDDPGDMPTPQKPPQMDPLMQIEMAKVQAQTAKAQADIQLSREKAMQDIQIEREKLAAQIQMKKAELAAKYGLEHRKAEMDVSLEREKAHAKLQAEAASDIRSQIGVVLPQLQGIVEQAKAARQDSAMAAMIEGLQGAISAMSKPKKVVRGPDGRVAGVEIQ